MPDGTRVWVIREHARPLTPEEQERSTAKLLQLYGEYPEDDEGVKRAYNVWCDEIGMP